jgi:hypothetical protein
MVGGNIPTPPENYQRGNKLIQFSKKERALFETYAKQKGWSFSKMFRICARAVILLEYKQAASLEEALSKAVLLDIDGRNVK